MLLKSILLLFLHDVASSAAPPAADRRQLETNEIVMAANTQDSTGFCFELHPKPSNTAMAVTCLSSEDAAPCCNGGSKFRFRPSTNKKCGSLANLTSAVTVTCSAEGYTDGTLEVDPIFEVDPAPADVKLSTESIIKVAINEENPAGFCFDLDPKPSNTTTVTCNGKTFNFKAKTKTKCGKLNADPTDAVTVTCSAVGYSNGTLEVGPQAIEQAPPNVTSGINATPDAESIPSKSINGTNGTLGATEIETETPPSIENLVEMTMNEKDLSSFCVDLSPEPLNETIVKCSSTSGNDWNFNQSNCGNLPTNVVGNVTVTCIAAGYENASLVVVGAVATEITSSANNASTAVDDANGTRFSMPNATDTQTNKTSSISTGGQTSNKTSSLGQDVIETSSNITKSIVMTMNVEKPTGADFCFHLNPKPSVATTVDCSSDSTSAQWRRSGDPSWEFDPSMDVLCNGFTPNAAELITVTCSAIGYADGILEMEPNANTTPGIIVVTGHTEDVGGAHFCFDLEPKPSNETTVACTTSSDSASCCDDGHEWFLDLDSSTASQCGKLLSDPLEKVTVTCTAAGYADGTGVIDPASVTTDGTVAGGVGSVETLSSGATTSLPRVTLRSVAAVSVMMALLMR